MTPPVFTQNDLKAISDARNTSDITDNGGAAILKMLRDRTDLHPSLTVGRRIVSRPAREAEDGELVLVHLHGQHTLRRAPVTEGTVVGVLLGVLVDVEPVPAESERR